MGEIKYYAFILEDGELGGLLQSDDEALVTVEILKWGLRGIQFTTKQVSKEEYEAMLKGTEKSLN